MVLKSEFDQLVFAGVYDSSCWSCFFQGGDENGCGSLSPFEGGSLPSVPSGLLLSLRNVGTPAETIPTGISLDISLLKQASTES